jgi:hypothetical protein
MKKLAILFLVVGALSLTSCVTNWQRNKKLNEEIFYEYLVKPMMGQDGPECSTAPVVK